MSAMSELATVKEELLQCSQVLIGIADTLKELAHTWDEPLPVKEIAAPAPEIMLTLADVRACLAQKSVEGHTAVIQALIRKYGAEKLSQVDPKNYAALMAEAEVL